MYGYLRETKEQAKKAGIDKKYNICRTGLDEYLNIIFPDVNDWVHDKTVPALKGISRKRPDYRSEKLKMIIEFDGLPHYIYPDVIQQDIESTKLYEANGYKVIRIPYFIQLTNEVVRTLFNVDCKIKLCPLIPSFDINSRNTPAYMCNAGIKRMKTEFEKFPEQKKINYDYLININNDFLTGINLL